MGGRTDRKEFADAFDDTENECVERRHRTKIPAFALWSYGRQATDKI
jgi:hypothetical protein